MTPKSKVRIEENIENTSFSTTWVDPKIVFQPYPEGTIENKSCSTTWIDPKAVFETYPDPKHKPLVPQKVKNDPKIMYKFKIKSKNWRKHRN